MRSTLFLILLLVTIRIAGAHDFWIELSDYAPASDAPLKVVFKSGHAPAGEIIPRPEAGLDEFVVVGPHDTRLIPGVVALSPAGLFRPEHDGLMVVAYASETRSITLDPKTFREYLAMEGLDSIQAIRQKTGKADSPARESYTKYAKCLVRAKDSQEATPLPVLGHVLEILPDSDPTAPGFQGKISGRVLFHGAAAPGLQVTASSTDSSQTLMTHTDNAGHFAMRLPSPGVWILKSVLMSTAKNPDHDWDSHWASLVFCF